jgi:hypothetical protein
MTTAELHVGLVLIAFWLIAWFAFAIPTSLLARRMGHPWWLAYIIWNPFWVVYVRPILFRTFPILAEQHATSFLSWVLYLIPGVIYWWIVALSKSRAIGGHADRIPRTKAQVSNGVPNL